MEKINEKIEYIIEKCPHKVIEVIKQIYHNNPEVINDMLEYPDDMEHITNRSKYEEMVNKVRWANNQGHGSKWTLEEIKKNSNINFNNVNYTEYDYAYLVNMLYAKCNKYIQDPSIFLKIARCLLDDTDEDTKFYTGAFLNKKYRENDKFNRYDNIRMSQYYDDDENRKYNNRRYDDYPRRHIERYHDHDGDFFRTY